MVKKVENNKVKITNFFATWKKILSMFVRRKSSTICQIIYLRIWIHYLQIVSQKDRNKTVEIFSTYLKISVVIEISAWLIGANWSNASPRLASIEIQSLSQLELFLLEQRQNPIQLHILVNDMLLNRANVVPTLHLFAQEVGMHVVVAPVDTVQLNGALVHVAFDGLDAVVVVGAVDVVQSVNAGQWLLAAQRTGAAVGGIVDGLAWVQGGRGVVDVDGATVDGVSTHF